MFKIFVDGNVVCNSALSETMVINPVVVLEANKTGSFTFILPPSHSAYDLIIRRHSIIRVERDDEVLFQGICTGESVDMIKQKRIVCEGELTYLNDSILRPHKYQNQTVYSLLKAYIDEHNAQVDEYKQFEIGIVDVHATDTIFRYTNMNSTMQEIAEDLIDNYGGYIRVRYADGKKYIDYLEDSPYVSSQTIELGKNLLDYSSNIDNTEVATRIIPLGCELDESDVEGLTKRLDIKAVNDGKDYVEADADTLALYGIITRVVEWNDVTTEEALLRKGRQYLSEIQFEDVVIECSAVDLGYIDPSVRKFKLLDTVRVISSLHGMSKNFLLRKMTINLADPSKDMFTFGDSDKVKLTSRSQSANTTIMKKIETIPTTQNILNLAQERASAIIAGADGGYVKIDTDEYNQPYRILIMDSDDISSATDIIQLNRNGIGFSNDGGATWRNAWTIDGNLVADFITSGNLVGLTIDNGNGTFHVDSDGNVTAHSMNLGSFSLATVDTAQYTKGAFIAGAANVGSGRFSISPIVTGEPNQHHTLLNNFIVYDDSEGVHHSDQVSVDNYEFFARHISTDEGGNNDTYEVSVDPRHIRLQRFGDRSGYITLEPILGVVIDSGNRFLTANAGSLIFHDTDGNPDMYLTPQGSVIHGTLEIKGPSDSVYVDVSENSAALKFGENGARFGCNSNGNAYLQSSSGYRFVMQSDGNVVLYNRSGTAIWSTQTSGK